MEIEKKFVNTFCYVAVACSFILTSFKLVMGLTPQYWLTIVTTLVATATYFINKKNSKIAFFIIKIPGFLVIILFDDGINSHAGYFLYYFPYILLSILFGRINKSPIYYIDILIVGVIFFLVNYTNLTPKLGISVPFTLNLNLYYLNLFLSVFLCLYLFNIFINNHLRTSKQVLTNEIKLATLIDISSNMIWSIDKSFTLTTANASFLQAYKDYFKIEISIGSQILKGIPNEEYIYWKQKYERALKGETHKSKKDYIIDNKTVTNEFTFTPIIENNIITGLYVTSNDITQIKKHENDILEREKNLALIVQSFDDILLEIDSQYTVVNVWCNDDKKAIFNIEKLKGNKIFLLFNSSINLLLEDIINQVIISQELVQKEFEISTNTGVLWFNVTLSPIQNPNTKNISIKLEEISQRKQNELAIINQKEFLNQLINNLPIGIFAKDVNNNFKYNIWNSELEKMFGIGKKEVIGKTDFEIFNIDKELSDFVDTDTIVIETKKPLTIDNLNINTSSGTIIAKTIKIPIFNQDGKAEQVIGILENITEIKRVQDELIAAEKRWNYALTGSRDGVWDIELITGKIYYSSTFKKMLGYQNTEFGNSIINWKKHIHPNDLENTIIEFNKHVNGETEFYQTEYRIKKKNGLYTWILDRGKIAEYNDNGKPIRFIGTSTDISYLKDLEEKSKNNEALLSSINQNITEAIYRSSNENGLLYINKSFLNMFGFENYDEALNTPIHNLYASTQDRGVIVKELFENKKINNKEVLLRKKTGETFWGLISTICVDNVNGQSYFDGAIRDISNIKIIEEQLIQAKEMAEAAAKAKGLFLSTMSHEIRTPMNAVIGIANLLLTENVASEQVQNLQTLKFSAESLMYLINDILDFSKIDAGKIELESTEFNLAQLLVNIKQSFQTKAEEQGLKLNLMIDPLLPQNLIGDPIRIAQIISNLVSNAVKFTEKGNVNIEVSVQETNVECSIIYFKVSDTGIGIPANKIPFIFDHFIQASSDTTRKYGGTGLGLAITKKLIELFNSKINLTSTLGEGTEFYFTLKFVNSAQLNLIVEPKKMLTIKPLTGTKVLLVEDNEINTYVVVRFLNNWNVTYDVAKNGEIAVDMHRKNKYDLILMDLQMPVMDGYEATIAIRLKDKSTPIIALTANAFSDIKEKVLQVGMNDYITKPFDPDDLYKKIKACKSYKNTKDLSLF